jgi:hypothetical protein
VSRRSQKLKWMHLANATFWALIAIPAILLWKNSLVFIIICSVWANFYGPIAAWQAARAEEKQDKSDGESS